MRKGITRVFLFLAFGLGCLLRETSAQQVGDIKKLPPVNWNRSRKIDVKHIAIDLRFDWQKKQAYGVTAIKLALLSASGHISLDAGMLTINSIALANGTALRFTYDGGDKNDGLVIMLDRVYQPGEYFTIKIDYHSNWVNITDPNNLGGSNGKGIRFFAPTSTEPKRRRQIWSMGEPESNRYWFPSYDSPNDLRTSEFTATIEKNLTVISNGQLLETKDNPDGTHSFHYKTDVPYANHSTSFVIGEYIDIKQAHDNIELHNFGYPDEAEAVAASVVRLPDMVKFFSEVTGVNYPYSSYSQVFVQDAAGWSGNNNMSTITENMVDDYGTHADFFYLWDITEAEALAHQWFGNYLSCSNWGEAWLNKSFAHYFTGLYNEHKNGKDEFLLYQHLFDLNTVYLGDWKAGYRHPVITRNYEDALAFSTDNYSTVRGSLVLHMLRKHLGEENWWKAIKLYVGSNANKMVSTEDFRKAVEEATGEPMDWFFDQWLYKMGHPVFEVTKQYDETKRQLALRVKQTQKVDTTDEYPQVELFQGKMEIEIDGKIEDIWIEPKDENIYYFSLAAEPALVSFDYQNTWIKEFKFEKSLDELLYQLQNDKDIMGKRWALTELVAIAKSEKTSTKDKSKIYAGLRNTIPGNSYWRIRYTALLQLQGLLMPATTNRPLVLDAATTSMLLTMVKNEKAWNRAAAINFLGMTRNVKYADLYLGYLNDQSDRVINAAATALGKCKSSKAFNALAKLISKPSWKNQSLISALNGLKELEDKRGYDIAFKALSNLQLDRWSLPTPVWDFRIAAVETIVALGKSSAAYAILFERFKKSLGENDLNSIFNNVLLITKLADARGQVVFDLLKVKFKDDENAMIAVNQYEALFKQAIKKN